MNNEQARFILHAYRPNGADAGDATFEAALTQAQQDPALGSWLERLQAFDRAVAQKLGQVTPPAGLREAILAGARAGSVPARPARWRQPAWLAMAASFLVLLAVGLLAIRGTRADAAQELPAFATDYVAARFFLSRRSANLDELRAWLARQKAPLPVEIPAGFAQLRSLGCKTLDYQGQDISLICFGEGKEYHLFVARRGDFPEMPAKAVPQFLVRKGLASAAWSDDANHYVVVTDDSLKALKECLNCEQS